MLDTMIVGLAKDNKCAKSLLERKDLDAIFIGERVSKFFSNIGISNNNVEKEIKEEKKEINLRKKIENIIMNLGISPNLSGYVYLIDGIEFLTINKITCGMITKKLYPYIASIHNSSGSRVERAIRHAIESRWGFIIKSPISEKVFGIDFAGLSKLINPTNSEFMFYILRYIQNLEE
jgi:two-component system response regulator (stage 0 sporulation protein A)